MTNYARHVAAPTPQTLPIPGREAQMEQNAAGGVSFKLEAWQRLRRFLILGTVGGTYYESEAKLTVENATNIKACIAVDGVRVAHLAAEVSAKNLAPKNDPAIFVLACVSHWGDKDARAAAFNVLGVVCRIGTHLFKFCEFRQTLGGGWGRGMCRAIERWYVQKNPENLVHDVLKYRQREGWSHRDILRLAHPKGDEAHLAIYDAVIRPEGGANVFRRGKESVPLARGTSEGWRGLAPKYPLVEGYLIAQHMSTAERVAAIVKDYRLERELIPTNYAGSKEVWEALIPNLGYTALLRNLGNLGRCGLLVLNSDAVQAVMKRLSDGAALRKARVHPWQVLLAARMYAAGRGMRSQGEGWTPVPQVIDCLDSLFEESFGNVEPTGKRFFMGIDVSGSMSLTMGGGPITGAEAAAAFAMVTLRTEPQYYAFGFSTHFTDLGITAKSSLADILMRTRNQNFGGTDCAVPVNHARQHKIPVDVFAVYSDGESWAGSMHVTQALALYRREMGIQAKLAMVNFTATRSTLADPDDPLQMNFVGLDSSLPQALSAFISE